MACANNQRQIGIALHEYHAANQEFPSRHLGFSFQTQVLPFLEQPEIYSRFNFREPFDPANRRATETVVPVFLCPSDSGAADALSRCNYVGNCGTAFQLNGEDGILGNQQIVSTRDIVDGLSNTSMISECLIGEFPTPDVPIDDRRRVIFDTPWLQRPEQFEEFIAACYIAIASEELGDGDRGRRWENNSYLYVHYNHVLPPNTGNCTNGGDVARGAYAAISNHQGGINVTFADGRNAFINEAIELQVWRQFGSRNGGEP